MHTVRQAVTFGQMLRAKARPDRHKWISIIMLSWFGFAVYTVPTLFVMLMVATGARSIFRVEGELDWGIIVVMIWGTLVTVGCGFVRFLGERYRP